MALAISGSTFAATATVEYQDQNGVNGTSDSRNISLSVKENINKTFAGDISLSNTYKETTGAASSFRTEAGLTGTVPLVGNLNGYTRVAVGQKFTSTNNFTYYSVEPGVSLPLGAGLTAKVGYRYRNAFDEARLDHTNTWRAGLSYQINKDNAIGIGYDRQRGDSNQDIWKVNYTRGF